jgi:serine/threonine-protein kinase
MNKIVGFFKAAGILIVIFIAGFIILNFMMLILVDHKREEMTPDVVGMGFEEAHQLCRDNNLYLEEVDKVGSNEYALGEIVSQEPHPGIMTKRFRTVKVVVSEGAEHIRIPFLANMTERQAKSKLGNAGLELGEKQYRYSDEVEKDLIISSSPMAEVDVSRGTKVDLIISLGKMQDTDNRYDKYKDLLEEDTE